MRSVPWQAVGLAALVVVALSGCGQSGGAKIDLASVAEDEVALNVEGMV